MKLMALLLLAVFAMNAAGCSVSSQVNASKSKLNSSARSIVGTSLVGAQGKTVTDQDRIDDTAARLCGAKVWSASECQRHETQSRQ